jgi:hypothetical protein
VTHDAACTLLAGYTAGALDLATAAAVRGHLASGCRACLRVVLGVPARQALAATPEPRTAAPAVSASPTVTVMAPAARRVVSPLAIIGLLVAITGVALFATRARDVRFAAELRLLSTRLAELSFDRADLSARLAAATRELDDARKAEPQREAAQAAISDAVRADRRDAEIEAPPSRPPAADPDFAVHYADDTLSVRVVDAPLADVLRAISAQSGIAIRGQLSDARATTVEFERLPLPKALRRLLRDQNFKLVYEAEHHPRLLELLSAPGGSRYASEWMMVAPPGPPPDLLDPTLDSNVASLSQQRAVPIDGALAETHGTGSMTLQQLIDTGVLHADPAVRAQAWRAAVNQLQNDPELRSAITGMLGEPDDASLGDFVLGIADDRAQEALFYLATQANGSTLRNKAAALLHEIQVQSSAAPARRPPGG